MILVNGPISSTLWSLKSTGLCGASLTSDPMSPMRLAQDQTPEAGGGGSYLQQRWPERGTRWLPWCGPRSLGPLSVSAVCLMPVCDSDFAAVSGPPGERRPGCAGDRRCFQTGPPSSPAVGQEESHCCDLHCSSFLTTHALPSTGCSEYVLALYSEAWSGGKISILSTGRFSRN